MSSPVVWILAFASTVLLIAGGFTMAVARFRGRVTAQRRQAAKLGAQLEGKPADPFGELAVIGGQLHKIGQRLGKAEEVAGLPVQSAPATAPEGGAPVTLELEQDLDLFKKELLVKARRIEEISTEKQVLAEKVVELESILATAPAASTPSHKATPSESSTDLVDVLQQEADELRNQIAQRDKLLKSLEKSDTSGLVKEVGRIRQELMGRNEELSTLKTRLATTARQQHSQSRLEGLEQEKEALASRALEAAAQLRVATQRIGELEQILMSRQAAPAARPAQGASAPGTPSSPPAPPRVPMPQPTKLPPPPPHSAAGPRKPPPRPTPPPTPRSPGFPDEPTVKTAPPRPPRSPGFPDEPTLRTAPPQMAPSPKLTPPSPAKKRRHTGSIFPAPRSKKDLLD